MKSYAQYIKEEYADRLSANNRDNELETATFIEGLKRHIKLQASMGNSTFTIHFTDMLSDSDRHHAKMFNWKHYPCRARELICDFLRVEEFYFNSWSQHLVINLLG
jgi:hypothetical protein